MTFLALDNTFPGNPKIAGLSDRAFRLHVIALCHCSAKLTDGFVEDTPKVWAQMGGLRSNIRSRLRITNELCSAKLWEEVDGGFRIHDYLDWNASAAQVKEKRRKDRERKLAKAYGGSTRNPHGTTNEFHADSAGTSPHLTSREPSKEGSLSRELAKSARARGTKVTDYDRALNMTRHGGHTYDDLAFHDELDRLDLTPNERTTLEQLRDELNEPTPDPEDDLF